MGHIIDWATRLAARARTWALARGDAGASLVEYALLLALVAVAAMGALFALGGSVTHTINQVNTQLGGGSTPSSSG